MPIFSNAKIMAKALRKELSRRDITLSHGECLEIVARQFGFENWNLLAAKVAGEGRAGAPGLGDAVALPLPSGWAFEGSRLDFDVGIDRGTRCRTGHSALIRSRFSLDHSPGVQSRSGLGALVQELDASAYRGRRLRLQANLKTETVVGAATIWLQVDRTRRRDVLIVDNVEERARGGALAGTQDWTMRRIVLDIPLEAGVIHYGFYLRGSGTVWAGGFDLREARPGDVVTKTTEPLLPKPINLDFSKLERFPG